jgi:hypothetical protein
MRVRVLLAVIAVSTWLALPGPGRADDARSDRAAAWDALRSKLPEARYLRHSVAVEAIMREMAVARIDNADQWGLAGLLHDIDIGETASDLSRHGVVRAGLQRPPSYMLSTRTTIVPVSPALAGWTTPSIAPTGLLVSGGRRPQLPFGQAQHCASRDHLGASPGGSLEETRVGPSFSRMR